MKDKLSYEELELKVKELAEENAKLTSTDMARSGSSELYRNLYFTEQWDNLLQGKVPEIYEYMIVTKTGEF
ncbi:MAG: hypothetical protein C0623_08840 [Desulfuromonas sp.]|nr:MAG: hypothetical protein C0623_08840 [Desulfuromonas sp.]